MPKIFNPLEYGEGSGKPIKSAFNDPTDTEYNPGANETFKDVMDRFLGIVHGTTGGWAGGPPGTGGGTATDEEEGPEEADWRPSYVHDDVVLRFDSGTARLGPGSGTSPGSGVYQQQELIDPGTGRMGPGSGGSPGGTVYQQFIDPSTAQMGPGAPGGAGVGSQYTTPTKPESQTGPAADDYFSVTPDGLSITPDDTQFLGDLAYPCDPDWSIYIDKECEVNWYMADNFDLLDRSTVGSDSNVIDSYEYEAGFLDRISSDAFDTLYEGLLMESDFYCSFREADLSDYSDEDGVCGIYVEKVMTSEEHVSAMIHGSGGAIAQYMLFVPYYSEVSPSGADISLTYTDDCEDIVEYTTELGVIIDEEIIYDCDDYDPRIVETGRYLMKYNDPYELIKLKERYESSYDTLQEAIDAAYDRIGFSTTGTETTIASPVSDKDLIFRITNDAFKFGVYNHINIDSKPGPVIGAYVQTAMTTSGVDTSGY